MSQENVEIVRNLFDAVARRDTAAITSVRPAGRVGHFPLAMLCMAVKYTSWTAPTTDHASSSERVEGHDLLGSMGAGGFEPPTSRV